jgi:hypothetical protein
MKTTKPFWISLTVAIAGSGALLLLQASGTREVEDRLGRAKEAVADLERDRQNLETAADDSPFFLSIPTVEDLKAAAVAEARAATTPAERVKQTREKLERLVSRLGDLSQGPGEFFRVLPDLLRVVEDLSVEEMIEVAEGMAGGKGDSDPRHVTRMILLVLAAEQDPQRVMRNAKTMEEPQMREMVLGALARRDPEAARRWVENSDMTGREKLEFAGVLAFKTLQTDLDAGLKMLREARAGGSDNFGPFDSMPVAKEMIPDLVAAMKKPENKDMREMLEKLVLTSAMLDGGVTGARAQVEAMGLSKEELGGFLGRNQNFFVNAQPEEALAWFREVQSPEEQANWLPNIVGNWAQRDFNAAGKWLGELESSPVKDAMVERYVGTVVQVDPRAALVWAGTIEGEGARATATVHAVEQWIGNDKPAAEKWMTENGIDLEVLRARVKESN